MATKIVTKNSSTASAVPTASDLVQGELAVNVADKRLFTEDNAGAIVELGTNPSTLTVTGEITANGGIALGDNDKATFGVGDDLQIYHEPNNSIIKASVGSLLIQGDNIRLQKVDGTENMLTAVNDGQLKLFYDGAEKLATTSTGIDVTGTVTADGLTVDSGTATPIINLSRSGTYSGITFSQTVTNASGAGADLMTYSLDNDTGFLWQTTDSGGTLGKGLLIAPNRDISFYEDTGTTPKFFWDASAESLGIGTSAPADNLDISLNNNTGGLVGVQIHNTNTGTVANFAGIITTAVNGTVGMRVQAASIAGLSAATFGSTTSHPVRFVTADVERMRIDSSGNVGIGTSSPTLSTAWNTVLHVKSAALGAELRLADSDSGGVGDVGLSVGQYGGNSYIINKDAGGTFFWTGGGERMRIDSSGNLLVGKTALDNSTVGIRMNATGDASFVSDGARPLVLNRKTSDGDIALFLKDGTTVGSIGTEGGDLTIGTGTNCGLQFNDGNDAIRPFNMAGNNAVDNAVSLGISTKRFKDLYLSGSAYVGSVYNSGIYNQTAGDTQFWVPNVGEAVRIQANTGNLLVGTSSGATNSAGINLYNAGGTLASSNWVKTLTGTHNAIRFYHNGTNVGNIQYSDTATFYLTSSDQRLKENIADADEAGSKIDAIQVRKFDWKADGSHQDYGMIAQELQAVAPEAVSGDADSEEMMGVDYSKLVPMLIKEIQSLRNRVAQLEE